MILIIKHIDIEGPGTFGDFLIQKGEPFRVIELGAGERLPVKFDGIKAVVVLGGPMNVYEEDKYPFLKEENAFIQRVLKAEIPYFGICLGSQLLAKAAGSRVVRSPVKEIGWYNVTLTSDGKNDPFFKGFREDEKIYHWHGDMFEVPANGALLATASGCPHQAFRVGKNAYGIQFHVEVTDKSIKEWCDEYSVTDLPGHKEHCDAMLEGYAKSRERFNRQASQIYENFLKIVRNKEAIEKITRDIEEKIKFHSQSNKKGTEKWVVREFLLNLGIIFQASELNEEIKMDEPVDIKFRNANFQIKEILDEGRQRDKEDKDDLARAQNARTLSEMFKSYTPKSKSVDELLRLIDLNLNKILYSKDVCEQIDILFYINLLDAEFNLNEGKYLSGQLALYQSSWRNWRSVSFLLNNRISSVLCANQEAPDFLKLADGKIIGRNLQEL